jgi:hypothetical protein
VREHQRGGSVEADSGDAALLEQMQSYCREMAKSGDPVAVTLDAAFDGAILEITSGKKTDAGVAAQAAYVYLCPEFRAEIEEAGDRIGETLDD